MPSRSPQAGGPHQALALAIRKLRQDQNLTQEELASLAGWHTTEISSIESGRRNLTYSSLRRISEALGLPTSQMLAVAEVIEKRERKS